MLKTILLILSVISPIPALLIGRKNRSSLLWIYLLVGLTFDVTLVLLKRVYHLNNAWAGNLFTLTEFLLLSYLYKDLIFKNRTIFLIVLYSLSLFYVSHTLSRPLNVPNKVGGSILTFTYIVYAIMGFYTIIKEQKVIFLDKYWFFWLNTALLVYASGSFLLFLFRDYLRAQDDGLFVILWRYLFLSLNIIKNTLLAFAIYYYRGSQQRT
jgi:hypothetical protein